MKVSSIVAILLGKANRLDELIRRGGVPKKDVNPSGSYAHAEGSGTVASGGNSHAEGTTTTASGAQSHAEGLSTVASGLTSHAEGVSSVASGPGAHAEGNGNKASGWYSHAEGENNAALERCSHVEGIGNSAHVIGAHVEGGGNIVSGFQQPSADHDFIHVGGVNSKPLSAQDRATTVTIGDKEYHVGGLLEVIGNGTSSEARSNARTLDFEGNEYLAGGLQLGTGPLKVGDSYMTATRFDAIARSVTGRVQSLDGTELAAGEVVEAVGTPIYVSDVSQYSTYGITETGWYIFARVTAPPGAKVVSAPTVTGADGKITKSRTGYVDLAIRFGTAATSKRVTIRWADGYEDAAVIKATDLAIRNLDYMVTFYVYDADEFATWEYALTTDTTFSATHAYYTKDGEDYVKAEVTVGDPVPADTYYVHSKVTIEGLTRNVTYRLNTAVDCPMVFVLPGIEDETHGLWFEVRTHFTEDHSCELVAPEDVKIATEHSQQTHAGINMINLHYTAVDGVKIWRFMNTRSTIPTE